MWLMEPESAAKVVIPVRYVSGGAIVQTTSSVLSAKSIYVRSLQPPRAGLVIGLQLYFPGPGEVVPSTALVVETTEGLGFWAEFAGDDRTGGRIAGLLSRQRETGDRGSRRYPTHMRASVAKEGQAADGYVTNLSRCGAFVKVDPVPPAATVVDLSIAIPGAPGRETAQGYVVHAADRLGAGVQFVGGSDEFRERVDEYVSRLAA
jgi:PilZ domain